MEYLTEGDEGSEKVFDTSLGNVSVVQIAVAQSSQC